MTLEVPESVRALSALPEIDYADLFTIATNVSRTPEQWARRMFGDVPSIGERVIWRGFLGLRLSRERSPETVAGWRIADRGEDWIRLATESWFLSANLVVVATGGHVSLATFLHYDRFPGHVVWPPLSAVHRALVPDLLRRAAAAFE